MAMEIYWGRNGEMKKQHWSRLLLWSHVVSVIGFYILLWFRTRPDDQNKSEQREGKPTVAKTGRAVSIIVPARNEERNIRRVFVLREFRKKLAA